MAKRGNKRGSERQPYGPLLVTELSSREQVCLTCDLPECKPDSPACRYRRWQSNGTTTTPRGG